MEHDITLDLEEDLNRDALREAQVVPTEAPSGEIGQQPRNYVKNFKKTVCAFWVKDMCMKGDKCGFLHEMIPERMPECQTFLKKGVCNEPNCPFKHTREGIKECNMYALGFCIYGPDCRYNHTRKSGPPPDPSTVEAAKPKTFRDINRVVNAVNDNVGGELPVKRPRLQLTGPSGSGKPPAVPPPRPPPSAPPPLPPTRDPPPPSGPPPPRPPPALGPAGMGNEMAMRMMLGFPGGPGMPQMGMGGPHGFDGMMGRQPHPGMMGMPRMMGQMGPGDAVFGGGPGPPAPLHPDLPDPLMLKDGDRSRSFRSY